jgi:uncharacterized membrane protein YidH (DUF202 family)
MRRPADEDPGLARERTDLAWQRTGLAFGTFAALVLGSAAHEDELVLGIPAALLLGALALALRRRRAARAVTAAVLAAATVAALLVVAGAGAGGGG